MGAVDAMRSTMAKKPPRPADEHDRKLLADVERVGWHVIGVEEDEKGPGFAYSIGMHRSLDHAEIILVGLNVPVMHRLINIIGEQIRSGCRFEHLDESGDVLEAYNVCFRRVGKRHYPGYLGYARWYYQGDDFPVLQCVWPDSQHRYPWHPGAWRGFTRRQPVLSADHSWPFQEGRNRAVFTTKPVLQDGCPILIVTHDQDGDWQFLCGTTNRPKDGQVVSLGCIIERDESLAEVADLPPGWSASRDEKGAAWTRRRRGRKGR
jgi:hypothetical protein